MRQTCRLGGQRAELANQRRARWMHNKNNTPAGGRGSTQGLEGQALLLLHPCRLHPCRRHSCFLHLCPLHPQQALDSDAIVEPVRGPLIPGFAAVKDAARAAGAPPQAAAACRGFSG